MDKENEKNQVVFDISKDGSLDQNKDFSINKETYKKGFVNIDDILILKGENEGFNLRDIIYESNNIDNSEPSKGLSKVKIIGMGAGVVLLMFVTGLLIYMMYPIEVGNLGKTMQGNVTSSQSGSMNTSGNTTTNITPIGTDINLSGKKAIDNLFMGNDNNQITDELDNKSDNSDNVDNNVDSGIDDPNKLTQNPDGSNGLSEDNKLLEGLGSGNNFGNGDEKGQIELLSQIRAKIEVAKIDYKQAKDLGNTKAMKLLASAGMQYQRLLKQVENNEIIVKNEIQNKLVEIQSVVDEAKLLII